MHAPLVISGGKSRRNFVVECVFSVFGSTSFPFSHYWACVDTKEPNCEIVPFVCTAVGARNFTVASPKISNSLHSALRACICPDSFLCHLKTHYTLPASLLTPSHLTRPSVFTFYRAKQICLRGLEDRNSVRASVCPSVTRVLCDETKKDTAGILIPHERVITQVIWHYQRLVGDVAFHLKFALK